jgi:hypothetical protein
VTVDHEQTFVKSADVHFLQQMWSHRRQWPGRCQCGCSPFGAGNERRAISLPSEPLAFSLKLLAHAIRHAAFDWLHSATITTVFSSSFIAGRFWLTRVSQSPSSN